MLERRLFVALRRIADETFPDKIGPFTIRLIPRENRRQLGQYNIKTGRLTITNLSNSDRDLIYVSIHELAHHCEMCLYGSTGHSASFYEVNAELLKTALSLGLIERSEGRIGPDTPSTRKLQKRHGEELAMVEIADEDQHQKTMILKVFKAQKIKHFLKEIGYKWSALEAAWCLEAAPEEIEKQKQILSKLHAAEHLRISPSNKVTFDVVYEIIVQGGEEAGGRLREAGYRPRGAGWAKTIPAKELEREKIFLSELGLAHTARGRRMPTKRAPRGWFEKAGGRIGRKA